MTFAHTEHGKFDLDLSLAAIEASFGRTFMRVHRSWLVNLKHVKELERDGTETRLFVGLRLSEGGRGIFVQVARDKIPSGAGPTPGQFYRSEKALAQYCFR